MLTFVLVAVVVLIVLGFGGLAIMLAIAGIVAFVGRGNRALPASPASSSPFRMIDEVADGEADRQLLARCAKKKARKRQAELVDLLAEDAAPAAGAASPAIYSGN